MRLHSSISMEEYPQKTVLNSDLDSSMYGFYASLAAGGFLLAYAIYYVTIVNVTTDYAYLTLGISTAIMAIMAIAFHEWSRKNKGEKRDENAIEEYVGGTAVLMGALSAIWLSRFIVYFLGKENSLIEIQEGVIWIPIWLSLLQTVSLISVMEISTRMIERHSLGTLPRTIVILAPISLAFSAISIWLDYSNGRLEIFLTTSFLLLLSSSILYSLRLNRSSLYLLSSGISVALPIYLSLNNPEHASLLVPIVILIGITATDRSLSRDMVERGSGVVVAAILFTQILASTDNTPYVFANIFISPDPFNLVFWLWAALLVGWFVPTAMVRTPAMPIALALSLALLSNQAALIGWLIGICAFIYLETRPQARSWVVRFTYIAMLISWYISGTIGAEQDSILLSFNNFSLDAVTCSSLVLFPILLIIGFWGEKRGAFGFYEGPNLLLLLASLNILLMGETNFIYPVLIISASLFQAYNYTMNKFGQDLQKDLLSVLLLPIIFVILFYNNNETNLIFSLILISASLFQFYMFYKNNNRIGGDKNILSISLLIPIIIVVIFDNNNFTIFDIKPLSIASGLAILLISHINRKDDENLILKLEFLISFALFTIFFFQNYDSWLDSGIIVNATLISMSLLVTLLLLEGGAIRNSTPIERLIGICYLLPIAGVSSLILSMESESVYSLLIHDSLILIPPLIISIRLKVLTDLSQEARDYGALTLLLLLLIGLTDISGGLLAIPVFGLTVQRASKHVSSPILISLPIFAIGYATIFSFDTSEDAILWPWLDSISYIGDKSELLGFQTPRWAALLLSTIPAMVLYYLPDEKRRLDGSRYGPEQMFGPFLATLFAISFLLPDERLAPIFIVTTLTYGSWKYGILGWFWITPIATFWASLNLISLIEENEGILNTNIEYAAFFGGIVGLLQYLLIRNDIIYSNVKNLKLIDSTYDYLGLSSRLMAYVLFFMAGDISDIIPFLTSIMIGIDTLRNSEPILFNISIVLQYYTLYLLNDDYQISALWPVLIGMAMLSLSWVKYNPFPEKINQKNIESISYEGDSNTYQNLPNIQSNIDFDFEKNLGLVGSIFALIFMIPFSESLASETANQSLFGLTLISISAHHMILGFQRDQGWRRMFSLVGLPLGLVYTGIVFEGLILVLMLFLAALTLIGQSLLYSSKGGLEIGNTLEGSESIVSKIGLPDPNMIESELKQNNEELPQLNKNQNNEVIENQLVKEIVNIPESLFTSDILDFKIKLDESLVSKTQININTAYESHDSSLWLPILVINSEGTLLLEWEKRI